MGATRARKPAPAAVPSSTGQRRRVTTEIGKVFVVDSTGDVYLEEEDEDGEIHEYLLDPADVHKPAVWDTAVFRVPVWLYRKCADRFLKDTGPVPEVETPAATATEAIQEPAPSMVVPSRPTVTDLSLNQISDSGLEIVDSTGIEEAEKASDGAGVKKRGKKGKK